MDINQFFINQGYNIIKPIIVLTKFDEDTSCFEKSISGINVYSYGSTEQEADENLIENIVLQVKRHREYTDGEIKGNIENKLNFISEHLGD